MNILQKIRGYAQNVPERAAVRCGTEALTYRELWEYSDVLAAWLKEHAGEKKQPLAVYGHKNPWMLVCFLACVKSGHGYCPIDISVPDARTAMILQALPDGPVLTTETMQVDAGTKRVLTLEEIRTLVGAVCEESTETAGTKNDTASDNDTGKEMAEMENGSSILKTPVESHISAESERKTKDGSTPSEADYVTGDDTWYIIFTSGSTGTPKGVQISADCLSHYLDWSVGLGTAPEEKEGKVFLNQAPFSFDLSVMDLYTSLVSGGTLHCLEKSVQSDYKKLMESLAQSETFVWVSTPSFAEVCLSEKSFDEKMLPQLRAFLFCGETLGNRTALKLMERFPKAAVINTYGPTESTVAVTDVTVTKELAETVNPLPVGTAKPGTVIEIRDESGTVLSDGEKGEIIILGDTVSTGYFCQEELTRKAFFTENGVRGYHTGDKGYLENGMLFYCGRIDLQVKLHGYRIELEDIENNIRRLPGIEHVVVLPNERDGKVKSLTAYVVEKPIPENEREETARLKRELLTYVPEYMVPKKFAFLEQMPMTNNGKADRKRLKAELEEKTGGRR